MTESGKVEIINMTQEFFQLWETGNPLTLEDLDSYYEAFPDVFKNYFQSHCQRTPERLGAAIVRYPDQCETMKHTARILPEMIKDVYHQMSGTLGIQMNIKVCLLVGGFGSNAYVTHDGTLHFAIETLTDRPEFLRVLVAHEMAHAFHFEILTRDGFDFSKMAWDGFTSLYLEGVATVVSEIVNPGLSEGAYFSFDDKGEDWLSFYKRNTDDIISALNKGLANWTLDEEIEWFRLRGGKKYRFNRLGYLIGRDVVRFFVSEYGLYETMAFWAKNEIKPLIKEWFGSMAVKTDLDREIYGA